MKTLSKLRPMLIAACCAAAVTASAATVTGVGGSGIFIQNPTASTDGDLTNYGTLILTESGSGSPSLTGGSSAAVPEPCTGLLAIAGLAGLGFRRRRSV